VMKYQVLEVLIIEVEVNLRPSVGQSVWCQEPILDPRPIFLSP
jgi:hypothetical protein